MDGSVFAVGQIHFIEVAVADHTGGEGFPALAGQDKGALRTHESF